jgi:transposase
VRRKFFKCYSCRRERSVRKDSILEDLKVPFSKFLLAVKLFVLEVPVNRAYRELGIAYNTTHKIYSKIRELIYRFSTRDERVLSGEIEMNESYFGGRRKGRKCLS